MRVAVYGGSFNPPHIGHMDAARAALQELRPDIFLMIPSFIPPHKDAPSSSPSPEERLRLIQLAAEEVPGVRVSDIEMRRGGKSYTVDTLGYISEQYPGAELFLIVGTDMLETFEQWRDFKTILSMVTLTVMAREAGQDTYVQECADKLIKQYGAKVIIIEKPPLPMASTDIRAILSGRRGNECLPAAVYEEIIRKRLYGAKPELGWLRKKAYDHLSPNRIPHVTGCEQEAVKLAGTWGEDPSDAAEAAILHDITKKLSHAEQLHLCEKYDIVIDTLERDNAKLLHAKTGAALSKDLFGVPEPIYSAIFWHTTGREDMTLLEKIIYLADYIEPTRDFEGVEPLRALAYEDIDKAMELGLRMSVEDLEHSGKTIHPNTIAALKWFSHR